jgi:hypothetical protein
MAEPQTPPPAAASLPPKAALLAAARAEVDAHRGTLVRLSAEHARPRFGQVLALGVAALDRVDAELAAGDAAAAARAVTHERQLLLERGDIDGRDGWDVTALAWIMHALGGVWVALHRPGTAPAGAVLR